MDNPKINPLNTNAAGARTQAETGRQQQAAGNARQTAAQNTQNQIKQQRPMGRSADYGVVKAPSRLTEGDIIRGEISDLRNNDITVTLQDNTILKATISDSSTLSIGQTAAFRLSSVTPGNILLEALKNSYSQTELTLINKALDEANLPVTNHNQEIVKALMDNLLPINKHSIQHIMQQAYDFKTTDMNTLALMNRLSMTMTEDTVTQFSNYRNGTYELLGRLQEYAANIPALLNALSSNGPSDIVASFGEKLLSIALNDMTPGGVAENNVPMLSELPDSTRQQLLDLLSTTPLTEDIVQQLESGDISLHDTLTIIRDAINAGTIKYSENITPENIEEKLLTINMALEKGTDTEVLKDMQNSFKSVPSLNPEAVEGSPENPGQAAEIPEETPETQPDEKAQDSRFGFAGKLFQTISDTAKNSIQNINNALNNIQNQTSGTDNKTAENTNSVIDTLTNLYEKAGRENDYLSTYLTAQDRSELINKFSKLPVSNFLMQKIASGEASTKEIITVIKNIIPLADSNIIADLFQSPVFERIFERFLQSSWTITPDKLKKDGEISSFYSKMHSQLKQFEGLIQTALSGEDSSNMGQAAHDMQSNIEFMKTMSEAFSYMQLPLKLQNQDAHADLYVYTQKEKIKANPDKLHVLLHLDLEHLGTIDIYIDKNKHDINTKFLLSDKNAADLIKTNSDMLKNALNQQGYSCFVQVGEAETSTSTVDEFINTKINTSATSTMKRFSFDIRA